MSSINGFNYSVGNLKIGKDTLIFNMGSATNCPSKLAGLCDIACYAQKSENRYPAVLPYRQTQESYWLSTSSKEIANNLKTIFAKKTKVKLKYVRVNEAGDFHSIDCLAKLIEIAELCPEIKFYTYTHRSDLIQEGMFVPANLVINTSNFSVKGFNQFMAIPEITVHSMKAIKESRKQILAHGADYACIGDCSICEYCKKSHGKVIGVPVH